jgi:hypothetical protein
MFFKKKLNVPEPPATLEYAVEQRIITRNEMLWIKKERARTEYEAEIAIEEVKKKKTAK